MIISFAGHSCVPLKSRVKELVREQIQKHLINEKKVTFYLGGYGEFDAICARVCRELKQEHTNIELVYITPFISLSEQAKIQQMQKDGVCDTSIYPPIERVPAKFAISKRNEWMMANADMIIAYVNHDYGGAYQSLKVAKRKKKNIINICDLLP
ncbi:MAG: DUF1273 family protein [Clostridia bacterium]|nr:DUF1273 family protein [Clostridia bacterium]MBR2927440.1 DUF1273 family protein [Clostridia bacterium]